MPSGFQQDANQLHPRFYRIVIDLTGYPTEDGNTNGGVTPNSSDSFAVLPTTAVLGKARARGNLRFRSIVNTLSNLCDCQILDVEINEANADAQADEIAFTVKFDRDADILGSVRNIVGSPYYVHGSVNTEITTPVLALTDQLVRAITNTIYSSIKVAYGASPNEVDTQQTLTASAPGTAANVLSDITVTLIDGTELVTTDNAAPVE